MSKTTAKINCTCTTGQAAQFQDDTHGKGVRVANLKTNSLKSGSTMVDVTCTVCGQKHSIQASRLN